jgi:putative flavoprotein involved in K+ transport
MTPHYISTPDAQAAEAWIAAFNGASAAADSAAVADLFTPDGHWRDLVALTWNIETHSGREAIRALLERTPPERWPQSLALAGRRTPPRTVTRAGTQVIEAIVAFDLAAGRCEGVLRLVPLAGGPAGVRAWIMVTALDVLDGQQDPRQMRHAADIDYLREFGATSWADKRDRDRAYADRDPAVIVVGSGQAGLSIAARLVQLGIDTLVIDREARIGDNWRRRYRSLTLHNEVHVNHLPYMPFPPTWPVFIPKDKLASWFEAYAEAMELNCWTGTTLTGGRYDDRDAAWEVVLERTDGTRRVMRPRHLVFATGVSAMPVMPDLPGLSAFAGAVMHSGSYTEGSAWRGRRALVLGTGNSAHDVAQDLHASGAKVTMIQRSPTYVVGIREAQRVYALYSEGLPLEDSDLIATAMPHPVLRHAYRLATAVSREADRALLEGLAARGFRLTFGEDDTGFQMMYLRRGGGYYFNVGCSDLIVDGSIDLLQFDEIERFEAGGARLRDGTLVEADLLVAATGFLNQQAAVRAALGDDVADRAGPVWNFDAGGELRNMWKPTPQPGLWFTAGSLAQCRIYSKYLALQIKARESGLVP